MLTTSDTQRIAAILRQFDCNSREADIYMHSLSTGQASVQQLAKQLNQNRVTVHSAVDQLVEKGLMFETRKGKRRLVAAEDPAVLFRLWQKKEVEWELTKANLDYVTKALASLQKPDGSVPTVKLYEGVDGLKKMLEETLNAKGEVLVFTYVDLFSKLLSPSYLEKYYARRAAKGIRTRLIFPLTEFGKKVNARATQYKMQVRFLGKDIAWASGIFAWNDTVAIQSFSEGKVTCTIIENKDIASFYRLIIFELCWSQAKSLDS